MLLVIDWHLALAVLAPLPLISIGFGRYSKRYAERTKINQERLGELTSLVEETDRRASASSRGSGPATRSTARFRRKSDEVVQTALAVANVDAVFLPALEALPLVGILVVLWYGSAPRAERATSRVGTFALFTFYLVLLVNAAAHDRPAGEHGAARGGVGATGSSRCCAPSRLSSSRARRGRSRSSADVRFDDVHFSYGEEQPILDGFTLEIPAGTSLALVGGTGSGKSTAAALLARFYDPNAGRVTIGGVDVRELRLDELRRGVGLVFEETFLFGDTVRGNVGFGCARRRRRGDPARDAARRRVRVRRAAAARATRRVLGERGFSLSGGQRQRIAIARAILADPQVLILDDATSAVDATKEHEIRAALAEVMAGRTTLVIAHRPATIALADQVAVVEDGRVVEQGTPRRPARALAALPRAARAGRAGGGMIRQQRSARSSGRSGG